MASTTPWDRNLSEHQARLAPITSKAHGSIFIVSGATLVDGNSFTLVDGKNVPTRFEYDDDGSVTVGSQAIAFEDTDTEAEVKAATIAAINSVGAILEMTAASAPDKEVRIQNDNDGPVGNQAIIENVTDPNFTVSGMEGGSAGSELAEIVAAPEGDHVFVLGYQLPGLFHRFSLGDFAQIEQTEDFGSTNIVRVVAIVRSTDAMPGGLAWQFSLMIDGAEYVSRILEAGRGRRLVDMAANVSKLVGNHDLGFRIELVVG